MDISFKSKKLQKICSTRKSALKELGQTKGNKLMQRMSELNAAIALSDISHLPPARLHELTGNRKGQFSVDLEYPYRLLFIPNNKPIPMKKDGGLDKANINKIKITEIEDTH
ncbi:killer suppression protein [Desulfobacula sp.]|uniref:type II toxin-antitoxin system RelE/ParE family toxin n=1 Tax=Desulfobacula sp. TaxID=2593537 RepID=UPI0025C2B8A3|nr:killer suppression protein [Desulfobacula sp.]MBC2705546.1 killer suppression protein [Desulfobacula sp.]